MLDLCRPSSASTSSPASPTLLSTFYFKLLDCIYIPREAKEVFGPTLQRPDCRVKAKYLGRSPGVHSIKPVYGDPPFTQESPIVGINWLTKLTRNGHTSHK